MYRSVLSLSIWLVLLLASFVAAQEQTLLDRAREAVGSATNINEEWTGPQTGAIAETNKFVVYIGYDLLNGGIFQVSLGVEEASDAIGWDLLVLDGYGDENALRESFQTALDLRPDGILIAGPIDPVLAELEVAKERSIPVVGWHAVAPPGPDEDQLLFTNITTDPLDVAQLAAFYAIADSDARAGVVVFTTSEAEIALEKSGAMVEILEECATCEILEVIDMRLAETPNEMPDTISRLWETYGSRWTHSLAINDLYFDFSKEAFEELGLTPESAPANISAGDGSESAFRRIRDGDYQVATVPEPLILHGWQMIDELNRAMNDLKHSGYVAPVHLITRASIDDLANIYDPDHGYREIYRTIWGLDPE